MGGGIDVTFAQHTNGYQTLANNRFTIKNIWLRRSNQQMVEWFMNIKINLSSLLKSDSDHHANCFRDVSHLGLPQVSKQTCSINPSLAFADWIGKTGTTNEDENMWLMLYASLDLGWLAGLR